MAGSKRSALFDRFRGNASKEPVEAEKQKQTESKSGDGDASDPSRQDLRLEPERSVKLEDRKAGGDGDASDPSLVDPVVVDLEADSGDGDASDPSLRVQPTATPAEPTKGTEASADAKKEATDTEADTKAGAEADPKITVGDGNAVTDAPVYVEEPPADADDEYVEQPPNGHEDSPPHDESTDPAPEEETDDTTPENSGDDHESISDTDHIDEEWQPDPQHEEAYDDGWYEDVDEPLPATDDGEPAGRDLPEAVIGVAADTDFGGGSDEPAEPEGLERPELADDSVPSWTDHENGPDGEYELVLDGPTDLSFDADPQLPPDHAELPGYEPVELPPEPPTHEEPELVD